MARINIEEIWWSDPRRNRLIDKLKSTRIADGLMLSLWRVSQDFNGEPFEWNTLFEPHEIDAVVSSGLATLEHHLLYVKGSKEHHDWLVAKREAARRGGIKSAQLRQATLEQHSSTSQPSYSPSSSSPPTTTSEIQDFEKSWSQPKEFVKTLEGIYGQFGQPMPRNLKTKIFKLKEHFVEIEAFVNWSNELLDQNKGARFYTAALLKEAGIRQ